MSPGRCRMLPLALLALAALAVSVPVAGIPFSQATPPTVSQSGNDKCVLDATSRGISSIEATDLAPYANHRCDNGALLNVILLGNNSLSSLPTDLLQPFASKSIMIFSLAANQFTATTVGNLFSLNRAPGACVFFAGVTVTLVDLSFNALGPSVPAVFQQATIVNSGGPDAQLIPLSLLLIGCSLTEIQPNAFLNASLAGVDLSYNDLSSGLHPGSFRGCQSADNSDAFFLGLSNCRLRSSSLASGVFDTGTVGLAALWMNNFVLPILKPERYSTAPFAPNFDFDPMQRAFSKQQFTPPGQVWTFNPPSPAQFDASWGNLFDLFPADVWPASSEFGAAWTQIEIGDIVSVDPTWLSNLSFLLEDGSGLTLTMAASSVAPAVLKAGQQYCPLHSVMNSINWALRNSSVQMLSLRLLGYDLPTSAKCGAYPSCVGCRPLALNTQSSRTLTVEPAFLEPAFMLWLAYLGQTGSLNFVPPVLDMWNPQLNRSDWIDLSYFCVIDAIQIELPALPYSLTADPSSPSFPFPPPAGLVGCLRNDPSLSALGWSLASKFSSDMLSGLTMNTPHILGWTFNLEALYDTNSPVPLGFFDPLPALSTVTAASCVQPSPLCTRLMSRCPYIVNGVCELCPAGYWSNAASGLFYCSACPTGSFCNSTLNALQQPMPCPAGSFQAFPASSDCTPCPIGTYNELTGQSAPASCLQCPPGTANPLEGGALRSIACAPCTAGTANPAPGLAVCPTCARGSYQSGAASFVCELCPAGRYGPLLGAISRDNCTACPANAPASPLGSSSIVQCSTGVICEDGLWTAPGSIGVCNASCPIGSACAGGTRSLCDAGSYQDQLKQSVCKPCGRGLVGSSLGSTSSAGCEPCPLSTYSSELISAQCTPCAAGSLTATNGQSDPSACIPVASCLTSESLAVAASSDLSAASFCPLASAAPIPLSSLLSGGAQQLQSFMQRSDALLNSANQTAAAAGLSPDARAALIALAATNAFATYQPVRQGPSLRLSAFGSDSILAAYSATSAEQDVSTVGETSSASTLSSASSAALIASLLIIAFAPWIAYRVLPDRAVTIMDQFPLRHKIPAGAYVQKVHTQFGAVVSWSFLCVAVLVAILLGTQSNTLTTVKLLPPSASSLAGSAAASWQLTLRVYTGDSAAAMASWCTDASLRGRQLGWSRAFTLKTVISAATAQSAASCSIAADCVGCGLLSSSALCSLTLPYSAQLIEWEVWVSSSEPDAWLRRYGVLAALPDRLLDAESSLTFSALESFYSDQRSAGFGHRSGNRVADQSGFELNFVSYAPVTPQANFTNASSVALTFVVNKADVLLRTTLTDKQTPLQITTLIASAVVSLFSLFALAFGLCEHHVLKRCGVSPGAINPKQNKPDNENPGADEEVTADPFAAGGSLGKPLLADAHPDLQGGATGRELLYIEK